METEEVLNQLFQNTNNGKLTHLDQVTPLGRQIGVAFIALLMQDAKNRIDVTKVVKFIKNCGYFSKDQITSLRAKGSKKRKVVIRGETKEGNKHPCVFCKKKYKTSATLLNHVQGESDCRRYYHGKRLIEPLKDAKKREAVVRKKSKPKRNEDQIRDECKALFTMKVKAVLGIAVNQVKKSGHGASVENFNTTRMFLAAENREKVLSIYPCDGQLKEDLRQFLQEANVICRVINRIGKINVFKLRNYLKGVYSHWVQAFGKYRSLKSSLHWMLAHLADLIGMNNGYSLAEVSENSLEASIKRYRYITQNLARQTSFQDNTEDSLKVMFILSSFKLRQFVKRDPSEHKVKDDADALIIESFFVNGSTKWQC